MSRLALLLVAALVLTVAWLAPWKGGLPAVVEGTVVRAVDGDTLIVDVTGHGIERVRVIGVDTPEDVAPGRPVQCWSLRAAAFTARVTTGRRVTLVLGRERRDPYGRLLAYVSVRGMRDDLESALLRRGDARTLAIPPNTERAVRYARLQAAAAVRGAGLWGAC